MSIAPINLDDRTFADLVEAARQRIAQTTPNWTDFNPSDPGVTLIDVFAYLTELLQYRVNRVPDKLRVELLRMLGVSLRAASPATVTLRLQLTNPPPKSIARLTRFQSANGLTFSTIVEHPVGAGSSYVDVPVYQVERVRKVIGVTSGVPGQIVALGSPAVAHDVTRAINVTIGVEHRPQDEAVPRESLFREGDADWVMWQEVESFAEPGVPPRCAVVSRSAGEVRFPPLLTTAAGGTPALAVPAAGRRVQAHYFRTDGQAGNLPPGTVYRLAEPTPGIGEVQSLGGAVGGANAESLDSLVKRAPLELASLRRAVTGRDYAGFALQVPGVQRAYALPAVTYRPAALPGTVDLILVPASQSQPVGIDELLNASSEVLRQVEERLEGRRVLGTALRVRWARYQVISVSARVVVDTTTTIDIMRQRLYKRLYDLIQPLGKWPFGLALRVSHLYEALLSEPGVRYAEQIKLSVGTTPDQVCHAVGSLTWRKPGTRTTQVMWFAGSGRRLFQSQNDGGSWEPTQEFETGAVSAVALSADGQQPTSLAVATVTETPTLSSTVWTSDDAGETWVRRADLQGRSINALCWSRRTERRYLMVGTNNGLFELGEDADSAPQLVRFDPAEPERGVASLASLSVFEDHLVAIAPFGSGEFFLSRRGGENNTYEKLASNSRQVKCVAFQRVGGRHYLWAGLAADGDKGYGCLRGDLLESVLQPKLLDKNWTGGSCLGLCFSGLQAYAATYNGGVLRADTTNLDVLRWAGTTVEAGLPFSDRKDGSFEPVSAIACVEQTVIVGTRSGVYSALPPESDDYGPGQQFVGPKTLLTDRISLPPTWLPCSGEHRLEVVSVADDE